MGEAVKMFFGAVAAVILFLALAFGGTAWNYYNTKYWSPKFQNVERETFKNTNSYVEGAGTDLQHYYEEYNKATTPQEKEAIREYVLMGYKNFDEGKLENSSLRHFLVRMREGNNQ